MCGIAGIIGSSISHESIYSMMEKIKHRGPDGSGVSFKICNLPITLAHVRLSIIDLSTNGAQPMHSESDGNVISFNGEIYNYHQLKEELKLFYSFKTKTDTEVILAAYSHWGIECISKLQGMFAFAIYDKRKNKVLIARDRVGIKPFYYREYQGSFIFCSEIKGLLKITPESHTINLNKTGKFIGYRQLDTDNETFFNEVKQLPAAHYAWVSDGGKMDMPLSYWNFPMQGNKYFDMNTDKKTLVDLFREIINLHMFSDVEVGAFVSGGIDSASVASFALQSNEQEVLHTFSAIQVEQNSENTLIKYIVDQPKIKHHSFLLDGAGFFDELDNVIYHHDEPLLDGSMYSHYKLCQLASQHKIKVLLSGAGGDELFGGYFTHVSAYLGTLLNKCKIGALNNAIGIIANYSEYSVKQLWLKAIQEATPIALKQLFKNKQFNMNTTILNVDSRHLNSTFYYHKEGTAWECNFLNNYKSWTVPPYLHYEDRNSMAFGVEIRVPFYDHRLIEFVRQFDSASVMNGASKSLIRQSFKGIVPEPILMQKAKYGFPSPIDNLLKNDKRSKELFYDIVPNNPLMNKEKVIKLGDEFFKGKTDSGLFWRALSFSVWYNQNFA
jgi:asparagine synthase (glutamine-hydrolysing)